MTWGQLTGEAEVAANKGTILSNLLREMNSIALNHTPLTAKLMFLSCTFRGYSISSLNSHLMKQTYLLKPTNYSWSAQNQKKNILFQDLL